MSTNSDIAQAATCGASAVPQPIADTSTVTLATLIDVRKCSIMPIVRRLLVGSPTNKPRREFEEIFTIIESRFEAGVVAVSISISPTLKCDEALYTVCVNRASTKSVERAVLDTYKFIRRLLEADKRCHVFVEYFFNGISSVAPGLFFGRYCDRDALLEFFRLPADALEPNNNLTEAMEFCKDNETWIVRVAIPAPDARSAANSAKTESADDDDVKLEPVE